jgi:hypothetical protein
MDTKALSGIVDAYHAAQKQIREVAMKKLIGRAVSAGKQIPHALRYLELNSFYVEDDSTIVVSFSYSEPYSGEEEVILTDADFNG